jgi:hypothetical protein
MKTVILVPYRSDDGGRRDKLWDYTRDWLSEHHSGWPIYVGESPEGPFNRGAAINDAARKADEHFERWDVAVVSDADNICDPMTLRRAVRRANQFGGCVFPFDTYMYLDERSSRLLVENDRWFVAPVRQRWGIIPEHCSGIQAISRIAYDKVGGFPELQGWGHEDLVMSTMLKAFASHYEHLRGSAYHLYHGDGHDDPERQKYGEINRQILSDVMALAMLPDQLREYLRAGGHLIP